MLFKDKQLDIRDQAHSWSTEYAYSLLSRIPDRARLKNAPQENVNDIVVMQLLRTHQRLEHPLELEP